jgi:uncharacterized protein involved in cysteine biosynthesis
MKHITPTANPRTSAFDTALLLLKLFLDAGRRVLSDRSTRRLVVLPPLAGVLSFFVFLVVAWSFRKNLALLLFGPHTLLPDLFTVAAAALAASFGALVVMFGALDWSARAILRSALEAHNLQPVRRAHWLGSTLRELVEAVVRLFLLLFVGFLLLLGLAFPGINILVFLASALYLGGDVVGMSLSYAHVALPDQMRVVRDHLLEVMLLGVIISFALCVPFLGIILIPLSSVVAAERICDWVKRGDPRLASFIVPAS